MKKLSFALLIVLLPLVACAPIQTKQDRSRNSFRSVPAELTGVDWKRTPNDVLNRPIKDEPLIWVGIVRDVFVSHKEGKIEIEWLCEHLSFAEPRPEAISIRPIKARPGLGYFALSLIVSDMTTEQAMKFKNEHTASLHYMLVGGTFAGFVERDGKRVPFLYTLRFGLGPNLAIMIE